MNSMLMLAWFGVQAGNEGFAVFSSPEAGSDSKRFPFPREDQSPDIEFICCSGVVLYWFTFSA